MISHFLPLGFAVLASATPISFLPNNLYPATSSSTGFILIANVTDPTRDLSPSINHFQLTGVHIGAGLETAVLSHNAGRTLYENGSTPDSIGIAADSVGDGYYPYGLRIGPLPSDQPDASYVQYVGINIGTAQQGVGITTTNSSVDQPWLELYGPDNGTFIVCLEAHPVYGRPQYPVRFAKIVMVGGVAYQQIPAACVAITLVPQCAALGNPPPDAVYNHEYARTVRCFDDVASVRWS
ncbi:hypothetical protein B0H63DRAFT_523105 [Podospora didyma]|uniref:DUF7907 domain-containing protein n=1 Tax=Podospora didyma TaxID=330526 RepID=A0AAE0NQG4_9PEZI|nr:hypothetical protein B0H63DRAFT_523105 [Podospora didyma]